MCGYAGQIVEKGDSNDLAGFAIQDQE